MARLYILGAGVPTPTRWRFGTSYVLQLDDEYVMIDCGPATTHKLVQAGLWPTEIDYLFFTHHHFDHNVDFPCFFLVRWDQCIGKENPLNIWGPQPTSWIVERLIGPEGAFNHDLKARIGGPTSQSTYHNRGGSLPRPGPQYHVEDIASAAVVQRNGWQVTAQCVHHVEPWLESLAYRVDTAQGSIVFAGDTGPCDSLDRLAKGADVFVANCWDHQDTMDANGEASGQTGTRDAANMASTAQAQTLILTHSGQQLARPGGREKGVGEIARIYDGRVIFAEELMHFDLW